MARCDQDPILHSKLIRLLVKTAIFGEITNFFNNLAGPDQTYTYIRNCSFFTVGYRIASNTRPRRSLPLSYGPVLDLGWPLA
jgi:hypothetical protein